MTIGLALVFFGGAASERMMDQQDRFWHIQSGDFTRRGTVVVVRALGALAIVVGALMAVSDG
jgi:hypothetical protein